MLGQIVGNVKEWYFYVVSERRKKTISILWQNKYLKAVVLVLPFSQDVLLGKFYNLWNGNKSFSLPTLEIWGSNEICIGSQRVHLWIQRPWPRPLWVPAFSLWSQDGCHVFRLPFMPKQGRGQKYLVVFSGKWMLFYTSPNWLICSYAFLNILRLQAVLSQPDFMDCVFHSLLLVAKKASKTPDCFERANHHFSWVIYVDKYWVIFDVKIIPATFWTFWPTC